MTDAPRVSLDYDWPDKDGKKQIGAMVYRTGMPMKFVMLKVDGDWFREEGIINDLKRMALEEAEK